MPNWNHIVRQHLAILRLPPEREIEIVEELALHMEAAYEDALADGLSEVEAEARAVQGYDWRYLECELSRAEWPPAARALQPSKALGELIERKGGLRMESFIQDLRFGVRMLLKQPGFTLIAVITLALGIGANTAIFSVVNAVLIRPLPYENPEQLVMLWEKPPRNPRDTVSAGNFLDWREHSESFKQMCAATGEGLNLSEVGEPELIFVVRASANLFEMLGTKPALGRTFLEGEDQPGNDRVIVLTHRIWQRRFGGDPSIIGRRGGYAQNLDAPERNCKLKIAN
jgi:hypothetical protein